MLYTVLIKCLNLDQNRFYVDLSKFKQILMTASPKQRRVYFQLLDSQGLPYRLTSVDIIDLPVTSDIFIFKREVQNDLASSVLSGIAASQLTVYKTASALAEGEGPLDGDTCIKEYLGSSSDLSLAVVLPPEEGRGMFTKEVLFHLMLPFCLL